MKESEKKTQIVDMDVLNKAIVNLEEFMAPLNSIEKQLVINQLNLRLQKAAQNVAAKDQLNSILPGWVTKYINKKDEEDKEEDK